MATRSVTLFVQSIRQLEEKEEFDVEFVLQFPGEETIAPDPGEVVVLREEITLDLSNPTTALVWDILFALGNDIALDQRLEIKHAFLDAFLQGIRGEQFNTQAFYPVHSNGLRAVFRALFVHQERAFENLFAQLYEAGSRVLSLHALLEEIRRDETATQE